MKRGKGSVRVRLKLIQTAALFAWLIPLLLPSVAHAQQSTPPKRVLVLYWYNKDHIWNIGFDKTFQAALQSAPAGPVEYYPEYLESNRFPGENQSLLLRDYLKQKYAGRTIDVVVASSDASLDFLLKHRDELFPNTPIVFISARRPTTELVAGPGLTGILNLNAYRKNLDLALKLHPGTEQVFVISGTLEHDKRFETLAQEELAGNESRVPITYLTDLPLNELIAKMKRLPERSVVLYIWQQSVNEQGKVVESADVLVLIARSAMVPIYGMSFLSVWSLPSEDLINGSGIVGGYITTPETIGTRAAEMSLRILSGERAQDIPVENAPAMPMFDWRELRRWGLSEDELPPGSIVRFRVPSLWDEYKWRIISLISLVIVQSALIAGLLINRAKRKRATKELHESQERYGLATAAGSTGVWDWNLRTGEIYIDPLLKSILGYEDHEIRDHIDDWGRFVHQEDAQQVFEQAQTHIAGETPYYEVEHRMLHKDGSVRWFLARGNVVRDNEGKGVRLVGTDTDITESKRAEEALRQSESRNRAVLAALPDLMFILARDGTYLDHHARDPGELFVPPENFIGRNMREVLPQELARSFEQCIEQTAQSSEPVILDYSLQTGGQERYYESSMVKLEGDRVMCIVRDVTGRKRAEEALRHTQSELAHVARVMTTGELAATIAHEVNQPLTAMVANANAVRRTLGKRGADLDEAREAIDDIVKDAHRASQVVGRIRSLLRKDPHRTEPLAINEVVEEVVAIIRNDLVGKNVSLGIELADGLPKVEADRVEMQQVILNLMMNAVQAMSGVEVRERDLLIQTARDKSGGVLLEVRDSGVGIASEDLERIFDAFYTTRPEGMGLGLSICRTIVEAHGGKLWAESNEDQGATLRFTLPAPGERVL